VQGATTPNASAWGCPVAKKGKRKIEEESTDHEFEKTPHGSGRTPKKTTHDHREEDLR